MEDKHSSLSLSFSASPARSPACRSSSVMASNGPSLRLAVQDNEGGQTARSLSSSADTFDYLQFLRKKSEPSASPLAQKDRAGLSHATILSLKWNAKQDFLGSGRDAKVYRASVVAYQPCSYFSSLPSELALKWLLSSSDPESADQEAESTLLGQLRDESGVLTCFGCYHSGRPTLSIHWWQESNSADNFLQVARLEPPLPPPAPRSTAIKQLQFLLLEYAPLGSLYSYSSSLAKRVERSRLFSWLVQSLCILKRLHSAHRLVHLDIKPHNLFLFDNDRVKIGDLSDALSLQGLSRGPVALRDYLALIQGRGSLPYTPPESLQLSSPPSDAAGVPSTHDPMVELETALPRIDVYGLGVTFYSLMTGHAPFQDIQRNNIQMILAIRKGFMASGENPWPDPACRTETVDAETLGLERRLRLAVEKMTARDPRDRPSIDQILQELQSDSSSK